MLNDNNALVQKIAELVSLLSTEQKAVARTLAEVVVMALSDDVPVTASFTHTTDGLSVTFTDTSTGAESRVWSFGDGLTSTAQHPTHVYSAAGTYCVTLTITSEDGEMSAATLLLMLQNVPGATFDEVVDALAPVIWFKLTEASGTLDNAGSGGATNDATVTGGAITYAQAGLRGSSQAVLFDHIDDKITCAAITATSFTCVAIFKPSALGFAAIIGDDSGYESDAVGFSIFHDEVGTLTGYAENGTAIVSSDTGLVEANKWNIVALVATAGQALKLYHSTSGALAEISNSVVGTYTGPITAAGSISYNSQPKINANGSMTALLDDLILFDSALTPTQLQTIATAAGLSVQG